MTVFSVFGGGFSSNADEKFPILTVLGNIALLLSFQKRSFLGIIARSLLSSRSPPDAGANFFS
jgi:hypothetical protein